MFDNEDSDDSDDIFSPKNTQKIGRESAREKNEIPNLFKNDLEEDLFFDSTGNNVFGVDEESASSVKATVPADESLKKVFSDFTYFFGWPSCIIPLLQKPVGGISMFGQVDPSTLLQRKSDVEKIMRHNAPVSENVAETSGNEVDGSKHSQLKISKEDKIEKKREENSSMNDSEYERFVIVKKLMLVLINVKV